MRSIQDLRVCTTSKTWMKKLRKLIVESNLAPCYPGNDECSCEFEECPICFLYYPSLNRSKCCMKGICTECFLQMKTPNSTLPTQCPYCKTSNYAVEYRGRKTKEERGMEQIEEQRVIEAKIRMRQQELQEDEERTQKRQEISSSAPLEVEYSQVAVPSSSSAGEDEEIVSSQELSAASVTQRSPHLRTNRDDEFDLDLEDIMVMEAIWLSIQENGWQRNHPAYVEPAPSEQYVTEDQYISPATAAPSLTMSSSSSHSSRLACAIAALAERQQTGGESTSHNGDTIVPNMCSNEYSKSWNADDGSEMAEVGTSCGSSDATEDAAVGGFQSLVSPIVPESFEEQMMLAMTVSLAETRALTSREGVAWQ